MTSPVSAIEAIEKARLVIRVAGPLTAYAYTEADDDGDYMTVEDAKSIVAILARQAEALQRENADKDARIAALAKVLTPFARIADMTRRNATGTSVMVNVDRCRDARALLGGENAQ